MRASLRGNTRRVIVRVAGSLAAALLLVALLRQQGWQEIAFAVRRIPPSRLAMAFGLVLVSRLAVTARWYVLLRSTSAGVTLWQSLRLTLAGLFANNFLPTTVGGDVVRLAGVLRFDVDRAACATSIVVDRLVGLVATAMALPFGFHRLWGWLALSGVGPPTRFALLFGLPWAWAGKWRRTAWEKGRRLTQKLLQGLSRWLDHPRALLGALLFSWLHLLSLFGAIWLTLEGMGQPVSFWLIAGLWSFTYFITLLPVSINGLGIQEVSMTYLFAELGGVPLSIGLTLALIVRTLVMAASLPGALFLPGILAGRAEAPDRSPTS